MTPVRIAFLDAAASVATLLAEPAVAAAWAEPSALTGFTIGGLSNHLASQVLNAEGAIDREIPDLPAFTLLEHYPNSPWFMASVEDQVNQGIVAGGETAAVEGPAQLVAKLTRALTRLRAELPRQAPTRRGFMPWWRWTLTLDDLLMTRMMEIAVHSDDLAVSLKIPTPPLPTSVTAPVLDLLFQLSLHRHGPNALLRAFSRAERAPGSISAF